MWANIGLIIGAYLYGSIPFSWIIAKLKGVDLRHYGTRAIGAANLAQAVGTKAGVIGGVCDFSKGLLPVLVGYYGIRSEVEILCLSGLAALLGHIWSIFLKFSGGRGGTAGGGIAIGFMITALLPWTMVIVAIPIFLGYIRRSLKPRHTPSLTVPVGMLITFALIPILTWLWVEPPHQTPLTLTFVAVLLTLIVRRLTADLTRDLRERPATQSVRGILVNRLLYDRSYIDKR